MSVSKKTVIAGLISLGVAPSAFAAFSFGVMADTQWKANLDGQNPGTVAVGIINQLNEKFIDHKVKFVIQVGDLVDKETTKISDTLTERNLPYRAKAAQALYEAGICFFPLRGNHEASADAANEVPALFPQTTGNGMTCGATGFSSPVVGGDNLNLYGLSYAFDFGNGGDKARFVLLDQFTRKNGSNNVDQNHNVVDQQAWISERLSPASKGHDRHGFVFSHKNLMGANHVDMLFGANPAFFDSAKTESNAAAQNAFIGSLYQNGVRYQFGGHDHNHLRSIVKSPDGTSEVQNIITSSNSYKFYVPKLPSIDEQFDKPQRETPIVQELYTVGYYIVTVDGPRVTVDHYASLNGCGGSWETGGVDCDLTATPKLDFMKRESFGYSLNGKRFLIAQGAPYSVVQDSFAGTTARILGGSNGSTAKLYDGRKTAKDVNTGWTARNADVPKSGANTASDVLTLWGMADLGTEQTDSYVLQMNYDPAKAIPEHLGKGGFGLATRDAAGKWVNAAELNFGGEPRFVKGKWRRTYPLGTYGVDPASNTAWAVINRNGDFAVARFAD